MTGKYEYKVISQDIYSDISLEELLNKYSEDGWELVTITGQDFKTITFRREK